MFIARASYNSNDNNDGARAWPLSAASTFVGFKMGAEVSRSENVREML